MAIEKTYFTDYDLTKIYAWFTANATGYFDSIDISEDKLKITCYVGELDAFTITSTAETEGTVNFTIKAENGYSVTAATKGTTNSNSYIRRLTKTNSGIAIALYANLNWSGSSYTAFDARDGIFITKDNNGNTAFVWATLLMTGTSFGGNAAYDSYEYLRCMNVKSAAFSVVAGASSQNSFGFLERDYVQLVPIGLDNQNACHLPNCCFSYCSNSLGNENTIVQGDTKYAYNGYTALKD